MPPELEAMIAGSRDAVKRVIVDLREKADAAEQLRAAEHRAFMAEQRELIAKLVRDAEDKIGQVRDGTDGKDGRDGVDGKDGAPGADGKDGRDGIDGKDGRDGHDVDNIGVEQDGRDVTFSFTVGDTEFRATLELPEGPAGKDGEQGPQGEPAYVGEARGLHDPEGEYRALDVVSYNGSEWRAKIDNPGPLPGDGWMLSASRGKRGDRGERGETGKDGEAGKDGSSVVAAYVDTNDMKMVLTRDDGVEVSADLYDFATRIKEA